MEAAAADPLAANEAEAEVVEFEVEELTAGGGRIGSRTCPRMDMTFVRKFS